MKTMLGLTNCRADSEFRVHSRCNALPPAIDRMTKYATQGNMFSSSKRGSSFPPGSRTWRYQNNLEASLSMVCIADIVGEVARPPLK